MLQKLSSRGYKSYIVGGYVRDFILGYENHDIDIVTNAPVNAILDIYKEYSPEMFKYNTVKFNYEKYNIDIAQMRKEVFVGGKVNVCFTDNLKEDYLRRDFTFNAIYMDQDGNYYDFNHCIDDCKNLRLKFINDPNIKCTEDPTRLLRAIYFILKYEITSYDEIFNVNINYSFFIKCDKNALNVIIYKILKLNKNHEFIKFLKKLKIFELLFNTETNNYNLKPTEFLKEFKYLYIDSIIDKS